MAALIKMMFPIMFIVVLAGVVSADLPSTYHVVGDDKGWTLNFDYQAWAQGKELLTRLKICNHAVFNYNKGNHNVLKVNGTGFQQCNATSAVGEALISGNDIVTLATPGRKWYICGIGKHCEVGNMKLVITVILPQDGPGSPAPSPTGTSTAVPNSAGAGKMSMKYVAIVATLAIMLMLIV
ncbi:blue copper protein 1a-like [Impatiens glandulifera]|uniref:blue copper protein 1a-like n=1 Tax=Impatiens glandulifera TaxID=253017 RepID=UPI001FB10037|nr:blue copper protein 1a-like [Impatiens glandulifera]